MQSIYIPRFLIPDKLVTIIFDIHHMLNKYTLGESNYLRPTCFQITVKIIYLFYLKENRKKSVKNTHKIYKLYDFNFG